MPQPQPTTRKHYRAFWPLVIIVIVAAGAVLWVVLAAYGNALQDQLDSIDLVLNKSHPAPAVNINDWQTYSSHGLGYTLKYPQDWTYTTGSASVSFADPQTPKQIVTASLVNKRGTALADIYNGQDRFLINIDSECRPWHVGQWEAYRCQPKQGSAKGEFVSLVMVDQNTVVEFRDQIKTPISQAIVTSLMLLQ